MPEVDLKVVIGDEWKDEHTLYFENIKKRERHMAGQMNTYAEFAENDYKFFRQSYDSAGIKDRHLRHWDKVYVRDT